MDCKPPSGKIVELILVEFCRGDGEPEDPVRRVERYHRKNGELLFEIDPMAPDAKEDTE